MHPFSVQILGISLGLHRDKTEQFQHYFVTISLLSPPLSLLVAGASRPRAKPTAKVEDFVPEGDVDGFFEDDEEEEDTEDEEEDRYVRNALMSSGNTLMCSLEIL